MYIYIYYCWLEIPECSNHSRGIRSIRQCRVPQHTTSTVRTPIMCMVLFQFLKGLTCVEEVGSDWIERCAPLLRSPPKLSFDCGTNVRVVELGLQFYKKEKVWHHNNQRCPYFFVSVITTSSNEASLYFEVKLRLAYLVSPENHKHTNKSEESEFQFWSKCVLSKLYPSD